MKELIERLRDAAALPNGLYAEAADALERLTQELKEAECKQGFCFSCGHAITQPVELKPVGVVTVGVHGQTAIQGLAGFPHGTKLYSPEQVARLQQELETERMRLAACGVIALANTPESAAYHRQMKAEYRSASLDDVERIVDSQMALRKQRDELVDALNWYKDEAIALSNNLDAKRDSAIMATVVVLGLDAGKRAIAAIASVKGKS